VAVVGAETGAGAALASGLEDRGASVAALPVSALEGRAGFGAALQGAVGRWGTLEGLVVASVGTEPTMGAAVADLDSDTWSAMVERPLHRTLVCFQGAFDVLRRSGGTMVLVVPTLSLVGAAGFGPWAAVTEGQRALARAAARAWGSSGVTVHCVAVPASLLTASANDDDDDEDGPYPDRPGQPAPALDRPDLRAEVSSVVHSLLSPAWRSVTGDTVAVDGGVWMTP